MSTYHKIIKYGNSHAITLSASELKHLNLKRGDVVILTPDSQDHIPLLRLTKAAQPTSKH